MDQAILRQFESQCTQEDPPPCQTMCPLHVDARGFLTLMAQGKAQDARKALERAMPLACLTGYLCEGDCLPHCVRGRVDSFVQVPLAERACIAATQPPKPFPLPGTGKKIAVAGSALSSLAAAWELAKKGHNVTLLHTDPFGGDLNALPEELLPPEALSGATEQLQAIRVTFMPVSPQSDPGWVKTLLEEYLAVYLGVDDLAFFTQSDAFLEQFAPANALTLETADARIFCGTKPLTRIQAAAEGKRAAASIDRFLQGVAPSSARDNDGVYPSRLFTATEHVPLVPAVVPLNPLRPTPEEARAEAERCIRCECLECVKVCPYLAHYKGYPKKYAREMYNNLSVIHGLRQANRTINSCAQCSLCAVVCPNDADMGKFCAAARQEMVTHNRMPPSAHEFALEDMEFSNSAEASFARHQPGREKSAYLFFPGCQLPASLPKQTRSLYEHLCRHLEGGVGIAAACCGAPAKWSGREVLTRKTADNISNLWKDMGEPTILTACASCLAFIKQELPGITCRAVWDELPALPLPENSIAATALALHDPCAARDEKHTQDQVRSCLAAIGQKIEELPLGQARTRCCGYGGLAAAANSELGPAYAEARAADTGLPLLAYCIMCRDRIAATGKSCLHLLDLLFPEQAPEAALSRPAPGISARQTSRADFRRHMLETFWGEAVPEAPQTEFTFSFAPGVGQKLEERRIRCLDVQNVLEHARRHGALFLHTASGRFLAALRPRQVTFWVEYTEDSPKTYIIHDAYCHRMVVPGVLGAGLPSPCTLEGYAAKGGRL